MSMLSFVPCHEIHSGITGKFPRQWTMTHFIRMSCAYVGMGTGSQYDCNQEQHVSWRFQDWGGKVLDASIILSYKSKCMYDLITPGFGSFTLSC